MGMDVYGTAPSNSTGEYFRNNCWWWRPLWNYCLDVAPDVAGKVAHGHSNDGDGLGKRDSIKLAKILREKIASGEVLQFETEYKAKQAATPKEDCTICGSTGKRLPPPNVGAGDQPCNGCDGSGKRESWACAYPFSAENVAEFATFLENCGGFRIC